MTDGTRCTACNTVTKEQTEIKALGHDLQETAAKKEATCTEAGKEAVKGCSRCDHTEGGAVIPAKGHTEVAIAPVAPTCGKDGSKDGIECSVCNAIIKEPVTDPATGNHTYDSDGRCTVCGATQGTTNPPGET